MNRFFSPVFTLCACSAFAAGCSSMAGPAGPSPEADKIALYESIPLDRRSYRLVKRIWVASAKSAGMVPAYGSIEDGASALRNQALALGGDAIMNFGCYRLDASIFLESLPQLICNGNVIKYLP